MPVTPPKTAADIAAAGGRHYRGRGLGPMGAWKCVACGYEQSGTFTQGCSKCGSGAPGTQVRKPGEVGVGVTPPVLREPVARPPASLSSQLQRRSAVDYDEIERRVLSALETRLAGGYTDQERARLYDALEVLITLWESGDITPVGGLSLDATRQLAQKVAPEQGLEFEERDAESPTAPTETSNGESLTAPEYAGDTADEPEPKSSKRWQGSLADPLPPEPQYPAPEFFDPDLGGDEGGQDDPDRDGS